MDPATARIVVVGAGQAGASLVARLRALGHSGPLTLVGAEPHPPYQRPPLSKAYLKGELSRERLFLRPRTSTPPRTSSSSPAPPPPRIDRAARTVALADGRSLPYDLLALTTGARPRRLPAAIGGELPGVLAMRGLADADALAATVAPGGPALIVGGGYIGLEAAAVLRDKGLAVTLIEQAPRILARVAAPATADYFRALHRGPRRRHPRSRHARPPPGDDPRHRRRARRRHPPRRRPRPRRHRHRPRDRARRSRRPRARQRHRRRRPRPHFRPPDLRRRRLRQLPPRRRRVRLESVPNAIDHAEATAAAMLGDAAPYTPRPWFWSDQYDVKLQIAGLNAGYDRTLVRPGPRPGSQSVWYWQGGRLLSVDAMNDPRAYMTAKRWIEAGHSPDPDAAADPTTDLKALG